MNKPLGNWVQSLSDGVKTSAGSKRHISIGVWEVSIGIGGSVGMSIGVWVSISMVEGISISGSLAQVVISIVGNISLCHRVQTLGDGVQTRAGAKWNISIGVWITISISIECISICTGSSNGCE